MKTVAILAIVLVGCSQTEPKYPVPDSRPPVNEHANAVVRDSTFSLNTPDHVVNDAQARAVSKIADALIESAKTLEANAGVLKTTADGLSGPQNHNSGLTINMDKNNEPDATEAEAKRSHVIPLFSEHSDPCFFYGTSGMWAQIGPKKKKALDILNDAIAACRVQNRQLGDPARVLPQ